MSQNLTHVETKMVSAEPGAMWDETASAQNLTHVERENFSAEPSTAWKEKASAHKMARCGKTTHQTLIHHATWQVIYRDMTID